MSKYYILNDSGEPQEASSSEWAAWYEKTDKRQVAVETIGDAKISTVFLGLNHAYGPTGPMIWETLVFGGALDQEMDRCGGYRANAEAMHRKMVERVKNHKPETTP